MCQSTKRLHHWKPLIFGDACNHQSDLLFHWEKQEVQVLVLPF
uniref:Atg7 n=1 Tax=Arundo donax TaxID=35708 RepID=A0A0A9G644_ARUDO